ncbi:MAG: hypothetical protein FJ335_08170 [Sphingomonadales bacterium]|nr:hypothetical protein [Sphingomonadales bacterium]
MPNETIITPEGPDAIQIGSLVDDAGDRFVAISFQQPSGERAIVTFTPRLFREFAGYVDTAADLSRHEAFWERSG